MNILDAIFMLIGILVVIVGIAFLSAVLITAIVILFEEIL